MEEKFIKSVNGKTYHINVIQVEHVYYWKITGFSGDEQLAKKIQEKCGFPVKKFGFEFFGKKARTAYWESHLLKEKDARINNI